MCGLANVYLLSARPEEPAKFAKALARAEDLYSRALRKDPSNIYAAHGLGCVFALKGKLTPAKEVFAKVFYAMCFENPWLIFEIGS